MRRSTTARPSWKRWTFPPVVPLTVGRRARAATVTFEAGPRPHPPRLAFLGARACELAALGIHDRVFLGGPAGRGLRAPDAPTAVRGRGRLRDSPRRPASAPRWAPGPEVRDRRRPRPRPSSTRGSWSVPAAGRPERPRSPACRSRPPTPGQISEAAGAVGKVAASDLGDAAADGRPARPAARPVRQPALGRGRRSLPRRAPTAPSSARPASAAASPSAPTSTGTSSTSERVWDFCFTASFAQVAGGSFRTRPARPLPPVADPQVRDLDRPVRDVRLRRLRPMHRLVPGRHRRPRGADGDRAAARPAPTERDRPRPAAASPTELRDGPRSRRVQRETADVVDPRPRRRRPGAPRGPAGPVRDDRAAGVPADPPISISRYRPDGVELTIRAAGPGHGSDRRTRRRRRARPARSARAGLADRARHRPRRGHRHRRHRPGAARGR